jgi:chromate transporter
MQNVLVNKRNYLSSDELLDMYALAQMLPGPSSTQTVVAIGLKRGGTLLAVLSLLMWILPATILMSLLAVMFYGFQRYADFPSQLFRFIQPAAIGIILFAGIDMIRQSVNRFYLSIIATLAILSTAFVKGPWTFPAVIVIGACASIFFEKENGQMPQAKHALNWVSSSISLIIFALLFIASAVLGALTGFKPFVLFENFYRFGTITFGGGYVLTPMMFEQFVKHRHYLSGEEFLTGYAISQAMPGPSFAFAAFTGGMALHALGYDYTLLGCLLGTIAIFLPGLLIMLFVYPYWDFVKNYTLMRRAMTGIKAAAAGIVLGAAVALYMDLSWSIYNPLVVLATFILLKYTPLKSPHVILAALFFGAVIAQLDK